MRRLYLTMRNWVKELIIIGSSLGFYLITGSGSSAFLLLVLLNLFEFRYSDSKRRNQY